MRIMMSRASLRQAKFREYFARFVFGGFVTAVAGLIAKRFGPAAGGLFLAFPAILPASASIVAKHEREEKAAAGSPGARRGRRAAGVAAAGAALGSAGLLVFAISAWRLLPHCSGAVALSAGLAAWMIVAAAAWRTRKYWTCARRRKRAGLG